MSDNLVTLTNVQNEVTNARGSAGSLDARLAPFRLSERRSLLEDLDVEVSRSVTPQRERRQKLNLIDDLKLLFAALGAGGNAVPLGDNGRTARLLSKGSGGAHRRSNNSPSAMTPAYMIPLFAEVLR